MRAQYPQLFNLGMNFKDELLLRGKGIVTPKLYPCSFMLCLGYNKSQKNGISPRIQVKIQKNPSFKFFSDLRRSTSPVISDLQSKLLYATRATCRYRNHGISSCEIVNTYEYI